MQVQAILIADCFMGPILRIVDGYTRVVNHWLLAPRARTQEGLNALYVGSWWHMGERYSALLTTLFVSLFYSALMPTNLIITTVSLFVSFWVDKYLLFKRWEVQPRLDAKLFRVARLFLIFIVWAHMLVTTYFFAQWPFYPARIVDNNVASFSKQPTCTIYCSYEQAHASNNKTQETIVRAYGFLSVMLSVGLVLFALSGLVKHFLSATIGKTLEVGGLHEAADYTECVGMDAYVPSEKLAGSVCSLSCVETSEMMITSSIGKVIDHRKEFQGQATVLKCHPDGKTYDVQVPLACVDGLSMCRW
jgi:hypothetical protein